jgi:hypothetical protein
MPISVLNFFSLTDPHDFQGIPTPLCVKLYAQNMITHASIPGFTDATDEMFARV